MNNHNFLHKKPSTLIQSNASCSSVPEWSFPQIDHQNTVLANLASSRVLYHFTIWSEVNCNKERCCCNTLRPHIMFVVRAMLPPSLRPATPPHELAEASTAARSEEQGCRHTHATSTHPAMSPPAQPHRPVAPVCPRSGGARRGSRTHPPCHNLDR